MVELGIFIESPTAENLEVAFQVATDLIYGQDYIVEQIQI